MSDQVLCPSCMLLTLIKVALVATYMLRFLSCLLILWLSGRKRAEDRYLLMAVLMVDLTACLDHLVLKLPLSDRVVSAVTANIGWLLRH